MDQHRLFKGILLRIFNAAIAILAETYAFALFLSSYSSDKIPYLFLALAIFGFVTMQVSRPYMKRNFSRFVEISHLIFAAFSVLFIVLSHYSYAWFPLVAAIFILTATAIIFSTTSISVMSLFNLREFKRANTWLNVMGLATMILIGFLIPILLKYFSLTLLLYGMLFFFLGLVIMNRFISFEPEPSATLRHPPPPVILSKNALFISIFISAVFMLLLFTFADYSFKSELARHYNANEIGQFLGPWAAIVNVCVIMTQIFLGPFILRRFGVIALILLLPFGFALPAVLVLMHPSLWSVTLLISIGTICRRSFYGAGFQMLVSVFPPAVQRIVQYQMDTFARLIMGFAAIVLIILTWLGDLRIVAVSIIVLSILMVYFCRNLKKNYFETLQKAINLHRFSTDYLQTETMDVAITSRYALEALSSEKEDVVLFGLSLLSKSKLKTVPAAVLEKLHSPSVVIKKMAIRVIGSTGDTSTLNPLMTQLAQEKNPDLIWDLVGAILQFSPEYLLPYAEAEITHEEAAIKASAIRIFLVAGDSNHFQQAQVAFEKMLLQDSTQRQWALTILKSGPFTGFEKYIVSLSKDSSEAVVFSAIFAARFYPTEEIIDILVDNFQRSSFIHEVGNSLVKIGASALPKLTAYVHRLKNLRHLNSIINLFSKFPDPEAEDALIALVQSQDLAIAEAAAMSLAYRTKLFKISEKAANIVYACVFRETEKINWLMAYAASEKDSDIVNEFHSRVFFAKKKYFYLLASVGSAKSILQIIPTLLMGDKATRAYDSALEVLELCLSDQKLKGTVSAVLESHPKIEATSEIEPFLDPWLKHILAYKKGTSDVPLMETVFHLRTVSLFKALSAELLQDIARIIQSEKLSSKTVLFKEGDIANGIYIVLKGSVEIIKEGAPVNVCREGDFLGEMALIDNEPRYATAIVQTEAELLFLNKKDFNRLANELPEILKAVTQAIMIYLRASKGG